MLAVMGTDAAMTFRPLTRDDFGQLARWLAQPHVARWWAHEYSAEAIERDFAPMVDGDDPSELWVVLVGGEPVGLLQYCRFADEPEYVTEMESIYCVGPEIVSIDYFIADPALVGRGLGRRLPGGEGLRGDAAGAAGSAAAASAAACSRRAA